MDTPKRSIWETLYRAYNTVRSGRRHCFICYKTDLKILGRGHSDEALWENWRSGREGDCVISDYYHYSCILQVLKGERGITSTVVTKAMDIAEHLEARAEMHERLEERRRKLANALREKGQ